jgi:hypothetical protein
VSRTDLGPTQPPIQWVKRALSLGIKRPGYEADHSPPSSAEVKEWVKLRLHFPNSPSWRGAQRTGTTLSLLFWCFHIGYKLLTGFLSGAGIAQRLSVGLRAGWWGFESRQGLGILPFTTVSRPTQEPYQPPNQWVPGAPFLGVKWPGSETDHSLPSSAETKNAWSYTSTIQTFMACCSAKLQWQLYVYLTFSIWCIWTLQSTRT